MNEQRKEGLRQKAKDRWAVCELIAEGTDFDKVQVSNLLNDWEKALLLKAPVETRQRLLSERFDERREQNQKEIDAHNASIDKHRKPRSPRIYDGKVSTPADELRLAMWFIGKIGDPERAVKVVEAASQAARKLEK